MTMTRSEIVALVDREVARVTRRSFANDARLARLRHEVRPFIGHSLDSKLDSMSTKEFAEAVLRKLGLLEQDAATPEAEDALGMIDAYVSARKDAADEAAGRKPARHAQDSGDSSFLDKYLGS